MLFSTEQEVERMVLNKTERISGLFKTWVSKFIEILSLL
jgi:hypothetical protein